MDSKKYIYLGHMRRAVDLWRHYRKVRLHAEAEEAEAEALEWLSRAREDGATRAEVKRIVFSDRDGAFERWQTAVGRDKKNGS